MSDKTIKFAILGAGVIASIHAGAIGSLENAELAGVFDQKAENASAFAEKYGIKTYNSYDEMLTDESLDAVCICTPSGFHTEQAIKALEHKKHVVLEKPMALSAEDADRIAEARKESGCLLTVISQLRFSDDIKKVKKLVSENAFGRLSFCDLYMKYWRGPEYFSGSSWKGTKALDGGGALMNQGIHGIDLLLYIAGDARVIHGKTKTLYHSIEVEDTAAALLELESGALGVIEASTCAYPGFERRIELMGSSGYVMLKENMIEKLVMDGKTIIDREDNVKVSGTASDPAALSYEMHARQIANFIAAIKGEDVLLIDEHEGKKAVKLIEDIYNFSR